MFFILNIRNVYAGSTIFVDVGDVYKITGETINGVTRYIIDLERTGDQHGEKNMTIFNKVFDNIWYRQRSFRTTNSTGDVIFNELKRASSTLVEKGPNRVYIKYENTSSYYGSNADCWISPEVVCWNFTAEFYLYPRYYLVKYNYWGNFTNIRLNSFPIPYGFQLPEQFGIAASYYNNGTYYKATASLTGFTEFDKSLAFVYNSTGHNKSFAVFSIGSHNWTYVPIWNFKEGAEPGQDAITLSWSGHDYANSRYWTYGILFADSGNKSLEENYTVWLGFKDQWFDLYYPASVSPIKGSYEGRDNITATYNFTVDSSGLLRFNFSTNGIKHFLPVFHIKDITSNSSFYKDHIWMKNYSKPNPQWEKLNNWTDFVIQDGNSSYFGYNYILLLINKTLGSDYEFWISNESDPAGIFTRKIINWNKTLMIWKDTNATGSAFALKYYITGLKPNCYYNVYNNSVLTYSMLRTDSQGNLPSFTIYLDGEKEIKVEEYPVVSIVLSDELVRGIFFTNKTGAENNVQYPLDLNDWNNASWNYNSSDNNKRTEYWIKNNGTTPIDICQKGENDLTCYPGEPCGSFAIAIANVSWSNSTINNIAYPEFDTSKRLALNTYSTIAYSLSVGSSIYLRYWLFAPPYAPSGKYNTTIIFKAVQAGNSC